MTPNQYPAPPRVVEEAVDAILTYYSVLESPVCRADLTDYSRVPYLTKVRSVVMWFLKTEANLSYVMIGKMFERDHTTVINACRRVHEMVEPDDLEEVREYVKTRVARQMAARYEALMAKEVGV